MQNFRILHVPLQPTNTNVTKREVQKNSDQSFLNHLQKAMDNQPLKISKHANERIVERNIKISNQEWDLVTSKVNEARLKGVNQPLVLMDQAALIVSAKNGTVITAMERNEAKNQLFTNIDGTIIL